MKFASRTCLECVHCNYKNNIKSVQQGLFFRENLKNSNNLEICNFYFKNIYHVEIVILRAAKCFEEACGAL